MIENNPSAPTFEQRRKTPAMRIGDWVLHADLGVLRQADQEVRLNAKTLHVLLVLVAPDGRGVARNSLLEEIWGASYPSDSVVSRAIADLRNVFGEKAGEQRYIRTLPKYGYQLVAGVKPAADQQPAAEASGAVIRNQAGHRSFSRLQYPMYALLMVVIGVVIVIGRQGSTLLPNGSSTQQLPAPRPLTSAPGVEHQPRFSPDGSWVIYAALKPDRSDWDLFRAFVDDGSSQPVATSTGVDEHGPAVSPAGDQVAYVRLAADSCEVVIQTVTVGVPSPIAECTSRFPTLVDWSPDGDWLAYTIDASQENSQRRRLYAVNRHNHEQRRLTDAVSVSGSDFYPRYSPSGQQLAFLRGEPQPDHRTTLWVVDLHNGEERQISQLPTQIGGMAWLDEQHLIYSSADAGQFQMFRININTIEKYTYSATGIIHPDFHPSSGKLAVAQLRNEYDLLLYKPGAGTVTVAQSTSDDHSGVLSPDEQWLAFISRRSGTEELWIAGSDFTTARRLTRFEGATLRYPHWHPDGSRLLFTAQSEGREQLYQVDIVTAEVSPLGSEDIDVTTPKWMPGGRQWVSGCRLQQRWSLCLGDADGYQELAAGLFRPVPSDEHTLYAVDTDGILHRYDIDQRSSEPVWNGLPGSGRMGWTVADRQLYYLVGDSNTSLGRLHQRDLVSGRETLLYQGSLPLADTTLHHGMRSGAILFTGSKSENDDVVFFQDLQSSR